ncbi:MAG TPA: helix-turn-helix transcriptional regulator [Streptosporangiaceae bacterium]|jgi:transcriptional regulator with XRE-family HTH domain
MSNDLGPVVQSALLREELIRLRRDLGLSQEAVSRALEWHPSKVIRIEGGKTKISANDLRALLAVYGVESEDRRERLETLARGARVTPWWDSYRQVVNDATLLLAGYEAGAAVIRGVQNQTIPALLQTEECARAITTGYGDPSELDQKVELRMRRQAEAEQREKPPQRLYVLDEAVIRRHIGVQADPGIMPRQLRYVADLAQNNDLVTVRIVPFSAGAHAGVDEPFTLLEFGGGLDDVLYREGASQVTQAQSSITRSEEVIADYRAAFESILAVALSSDDSIGLIRRAADDLQTG